MMRKEKKAKLLELSKKVRVQLTFGTDSDRFAILDILDRIIDYLLEELE